MQCKLLEKYDSEYKNFPYFYHLEMMTINVWSIPIQYFLMCLLQASSNIEKNEHSYFVFYFNETSSSFYH